MKLVTAAIALMFISSGLMAQDISITGTISRTIKVPIRSGISNKNTRLAMPTTKKEIKLLRMSLSNKAKQLLADKAHDTLTSQSSSLSSSLLTSQKRPTQVQLGMNKVPVLNQGNHGSCAMFAVTAAVDAVLNKGDYVSQLCQLQVGNYLSANGYIPSGWNGSLGRLVLSQMQATGIVSKDQQTLQGCGDLTEYPTYEEDPVSSMTLESFHQLSQEFNIGWWTLLDVYDVVTERIDTNITLHLVKEALNQGDRVAFGVLLFDFDQGVVGAVGKKGSSYDSWVLTPEMTRDIWLRPWFGGHEMVITGYDDNAIATDDKGREYKGLLTLRNSWGDSIGDHGDFYMSYDYFKTLVIEAQQIHTAMIDNSDDEEGAKTA